MLASESCPVSHIEGDDWLVNDGPKPPGLRYGGRSLPSNFGKKNEANFFDSGVVDFWGILGVFLSLKRRKIAKIVTREIARHSSLIHDLVSKCVFGLVIVKQDCYSALCL